MRNPPALETVELGHEPYVVVRCPEGPDGAFDILVKAGGVGDEDDVAAVLLLVVEHLTGVRADLYARQIDVTRRAAGQRELWPTRWATADDEAQPVLGRPSGSDGDHG